MVIAVWDNNLPMMLESAPTVTAVPVKMMPLNVEVTPTVSLLLSQTTAYWDETIVYFVHLRMSGFVLESSLCQI
ncbi:hypothetical protein SAMN06296008_11280 [Polynucleobacter kasalickyi]|uniref:Uncharacterized protein n=1 Tax=Polynucleobacter kasalickyi TaxID=1938817 RepID=A0A1W2BCW6_9BURK|nr:hypothetical protein [Polynucleobacter kasalickyi]SMC70863.1 hypothetical protein SAMN06296008_11280 [Polynucleobacter kasalickyi]